MHNSAYVRLQKKYYYVTGGVYQNVNTNYQEFNGCFELQKKEGGSWTSVSTGLSLTPEGNWTNNSGLPVYDDSGEPIIYRFKETLPEGWHAGTDFVEKVEGEDRVVYSGEFTLTEQIGKGTGGAKEITINNDRNGSFTLTKKFYKADSTGIVEDKLQEASFQLYRQAGENGEIHLYDDTVYTTGETGSFTVRDLPRETSRGIPYFYYWVETDREDDYRLADTVSITVDGKTLQALGPYTFAKVGEGEVNLSQEIIARNIQQKVPVVVKKVQEGTQKFVDGAAFSVYRKSTESGPETAVREDISIENANGALLLLEPGYIYRFEETTVPKGYQDVTDKKDLTLDLTDIETVDENTQEYAVTLENRPDPSITVEKTRLSTAGTSFVTLDGVEFEIYTKENDNFVRAKGYDGEALSLKSGSRVQLPAGTYYLREVVPDGNPNQVLDPEEFFDLYKELCDEKIGPEKDREGKVYFGPYTVTEEEETWDLGEIPNYSELGRAVVTKTAADRNSGLGGAVLKIYRKDSEGKEIPLGMNGTDLTVTSGINGQAVVTGLPIYDEDGSKYTYYVKETEAPSGYYVSDTELSFTLSAGETVSVGMDGKPLVIVNQPETSLTIHKEYYNAWEYQFTNKSYRLPGTVIALYRWNEDTQVYDLMETGTTDSTGAVTFDGLTQEDTYVAVEVCVPDEEAYEYLEPKWGSYLKRNYAGAEDTLPQTLTKEELGKYYYVTKKAASGDPAQGQTETMTNIESWTQLHVLKYKYQTEEDRKNDKKTPANHAKFVLYQQILPDGAGTELSFAEKNCTEIGSYSSGTLYDEDGVRQDGWFATDILKVRENVVYWLVETEGGPSAEIKPENQIILIRPEGSAYTNNTKNFLYDGEEPVICTGFEEYKRNTITSMEVENDPPKGEGELRYASVRIAKWAGAYDPDSGDRTEKYTPLGNVKFDLWLADQNGNLVEKLDVLTVGLDNTENQENLTAWAASESFDFDVLKDTYGERNQGEEDIIWLDEETNIGYARVAIVESSAPTGYIADTDTYYMLMCFAPKEADEPYSETFNDAYYIKAADGEVPLASEQQGIVWAVDANDVDGKPIKSIADVEGVDDRYRLVNWPTDNFAVTVRKYGYQPVEETLKMTSRELDSYFESNPGRVALSDVGMKLQRYDSKQKQWRDYNYNSLTFEENASFTTNSAGSFSFPNGLNIGWYRIIELNGNADYENIYTGKALNEGADIRNAAALYFDVSSENLNLSMYNPAKLSLELEKTDMDGTAVKGATFTLTSGNTGLKGEPTGEDGSTVISGIGTGTWKLTESVSGYSDDYFTKYFEDSYPETEYPGLSALVGSGLSLGYTTALTTEENGLPDVVITKITDFGDYGLTGTASLTIRNPKLVSLTVKKIDEDQTKGEVLLSGARFQVEYQPFASIQGSQTAGDSWTVVKDGSGKAQFTTGADGTFTLSGQQPGIYRITELQAPSGYEKIENETVMLVALTGGLDITEVKTADSTTIPVSKKETEAELTFENRKLTSLEISKELTGLPLPKGTSESFTFTLYESETAEKAVGTGIVRISVENDGTVTMTPAEIGGLSQGRTYYLEESSFDTQEFVLTGAKDTQTDAALEEVSDGAGGGRRLFKVTIPSDGSQAEVTVTNQSLYAQFTLLKVNGDNGTPLPEAEFEVYRLENEGMPEETKTKLTGDEIQWTIEGVNGEYQARILLDDVSGETFLIHETKAPEGYLLPEEDTGDIRIELKPGENRTHGVWTSGQSDEALRSDLVAPNYNGASVKLTKYNNVRESLAHDPLAGVTFAVYNKTGSGWVIMNHNETTDASGVINWTLPGGGIYAVAEVGETAGYTGLESVWTEGEQETALQTETLENGTVLYVLNDGKPLTAGSSYAYQAYNEPYLELEIRKRDVSGAAVVPEAEVSVYEVPETMKEALTGEELTEEQLQALMTQENLVVSGVWTNKSGSGYTFADGSVNPALGTVVSGRSYLVVETAVRTSGSGTYDSIIKDDSRVVWYQVHAIPEGDTEKQVVTLKNVLGHADVKLDKTTDTPEISGSLLELGEGETKTVSYTLSPAVGDNSYALDSFVLKDTGLEAYHKGSGGNNTKLDFDSYLKEKYTVRTVTVGAASHEVGNYSLDNPTAASVISAKVTFLGFDGNPVYEKTISSLNGSGKTVVLPEGSAKAASVEVSYYAQSFWEETGYALGQNFKPGEVKLTIELGKQTDGAQVQSIDRIVNKSEAEIAYRRWNEEGIQAEEPVTEKAEAEAQNTFGSISAPTVFVSKTAAQSQVNIDDELTYTVTLTNKSASGSGTAMKNPIVVDLLPQGTELVSMAQGEISGNGGSSFSGFRYRSESDGGNTAGLAFLTGELAPGDSVSVAVTVKIATSVVRYGNVLTNHVYVTSDVRGAQNVDNPAAASFRNTNGEWAEPLSRVASGLEADRLASLANMLDDIGGYGYISASANVEWHSTSNMATSKSGYGDLDAEEGRTYSTTRVATASNNGWVDFRLTVSNASSTEGVAKLALVDVLPAEGDRVSGGTERHSQWPLSFDGNINVYKLNADGTTDQITGYKLYYYTGNLEAGNSGAYADVYEAVENAHAGCPAGWMVDIPENKSDIKAFIIVLNDDVYLGSNESLFVEYRTRVKEYGAEELESVAYLNAVNSFATSYSYYFLGQGSPEDAQPNDGIIGSNSVSATIQQEPVDVGGHVWIDRNENGIWDENEDISDLSKYKIIQDLMDKIEIRLYTYNNATDQSIQSTPYEHPNAVDVDENAEWNTWLANANFKFTDLYSAALETGVTEGEAYDGDNRLIISKLKGANPYTYTISVTLPEEIAGKFAFTAPFEGSDGGRSRHPDQITDKEKTDSNFTEQTSTAGTSERFYLWPVTNTFDNTKDVGLMLHRDLKITKTAADDPNTKINGAQFSVYGPFAAGTGASADLTKLKPVFTGPTEGDGTLLVPGLQWFSEYVIVETAAAGGYDLKDAAASGTNIEAVDGQENTWLLKVPEKESLVREESMTVTNVRRTTTDIEASKTLTGKTLTEGAFQFDLLGADGVTVLDGYGAVTNDANGTITFRNIPLEGVGTHIFYIREQSPEGGKSDGVTYDNTIYRVVVTTGWNETEQTLEVESIQYFANGSNTPSADGAKFENVYEATGSWTPEGTKVLTGRDMKQGETFTFSVTETVKDGTDNTDKVEVVSTGSVRGGKDGVASVIIFTPISYSLLDVGIHTYTITEDKGGTTDRGLSYDKASFTVTVKVSDNGDGTLTAKTVDPESEQEVTPDIQFKNTYIPAPVSYAPAVKKTLTGHVLPEETKNFTFTLAKGSFTPENGAELPEKTAVTLQVNGKNLPASANGTFGEVKFTKAGTYTFTIRENTVTETGYTYDPAIWTLTVVVTDDQNGTLSIDKTYQSSVAGTQESTTEAAFTNTYQPQPTTTTLKVSKAVTGEEMPEDETFAFKLAYGGNDAAADGVIMPDVIRKEITVSQSGEAGRKSAEFDAITFNKAGTFIFLITEEVENLPEGYDRGVVTTKRAQVTVVDRNGALAVTDVTYYVTGPKEEGASKDAAAFTNRYNTVDTVFTPQVTKSLNGDTPPGAKMFTFSIEEKEDYGDSVIMPTPATTSITFNGETGEGRTASFGAITFTEAGTYAFMIKEESGTANDGYTYDDAKWTLTVEVEDKGGRLEVKNYSYAKDGTVQQGAVAASFENEYHVKPVDYTPQVVKTMKQGGDVRPADKTFEFTLVPGQNNPTGGAEIESNDTTASVTVPVGSETGKEIRPGTDSFGKITFKQRGTYTFLIQEKAGETDKGYTYDTALWTLTVVVDDVNSQLTVTSHTYTKEGVSETEAAKFENDYHVKPTHYTPKVEKMMAGETNRPEEVSFTFTLTPDEKNPEGAQITEDGKQAVIQIIPADQTAKEASFGQITFTKAGEYRFQIQEEDNDVNGYTCDTEPWTLTLVVEDKNGQLDVTSHTYTRNGDADQEEHAVFTNKYQVKPVTYEPKVKKTVTGDVPAGKDAEFSFKLKLTKADPVDGVDMTSQDEKEVKVTGNGEKLFEKITFSRAGTYEFQIREEKGNKPGYSYDGNIWNLTITVKDVGGELQIESSSYIQQRPGTLTSTTEAEFTNEYATTKTTYTPGISKEITGDRISADSLFHFTLTPDANNPEGASLESPDTLKTQVEGAKAAAFEAITFTKAGTYIFTITEENDGVPGYTYDNAAWTLKVTVEDKDSILTVTETSYTKEGGTEEKENEAAFTNEYQVTPAEYTPQVRKTVTGELPDGKRDAFRFQMTARTDNPEGAVFTGNTTAQVNGSGTTAFGTIRFEQPGTYRFEIREIDDKVNGYQYDGSVWTLTIVVKDTNAVLSVESAVYTKQDGTSASDMAVFQNHYTPEAEPHEDDDDSSSPGTASYTPQVAKQVTGILPSADTMFRFILQAAADNPEGAALESQEAVRTGAGTAAFGKITFSRPGTYRFNIWEEDRGETGYTYDKNIWLLTVTVENVDGSLKVTSAVYSVPGTEITNTAAAQFVNQYSVAQVISSGVQTGDNAKILQTLAALLISGLVIVILLLAYRKRRKDEKK